MKKERSAQTAAWRNRIVKTGLTNKQLVRKLEDAGAIAILTHNWSSGFGVDKIFSASTQRIPTIDVALEDYGMLYRLAESGQPPMLHLTSTSRHGNLIPVYNTLAEM
jgi:hypothetical protein